jgi:uncharacterized protein
MKDRVFRDPVHGLVEFEGDDLPLAQVLETRVFQRLRRIKQMGFAWLVYPGAEHSRFGHALGAFHIARRVASSLSLEPRIRRHVLLAALLHDIGHGPFSHAWEHVFAGGDHERWGGRLVTEDAELAGVLEELEPDLPATLRRFWDKTYAPAFARKLVSSQLDVDRLDYLLRDGHYSGAGYATYDLDWIIHALQIATIHTGDDPNDLVVDYRRGMYAVEQYLFARSYMYAQVYHHKTVRAAEWLFIKVMERFAELTRHGAEPPHLRAAGRMAENAELDVSEYIGLDDVALLGALDRWAGHGPEGEAGAASDPILRDLAGRLVRRRLFKTVDLGDDATIIDIVREPAAEIAARRFGEAGRFYHQIDNARQVGYLAREDVELHVIDHPRYGTVTLGRLLEDMPLGQPMSRIRLVCAPELVDDMRPLAQKALKRRRTGRRKR